MNEKMKKKLLKLLAKSGISEEKAASVLAELEKEDPAELAAEPGEEVNKEVPPAEGEVVTEGEKVEPVEPNGDVPPVGEEGKGEEKHEPEEPNEAPSSEVKPEASIPEEEKPDEVKPELPDEKVDMKYDELMKAHEGLLAEFNSLKEALIKSGVLTSVDTQPIGVDQNLAPANEPVSSLGDTLAKLNRGRRY